MDIRIDKTENTSLLAKLNHDVQQLHNEIEPEIFKPYSEEGMKCLFEEIILNSNSSAYVAFVENKPAGYILLSEVHKEENYFRKSYSVLYIDQICVDEYYRGKGVGKALVNYSKLYAKERNIMRLEMDYWSKNKYSGEFFRSQGFANFNERLYSNVD